MTIATAKVIGSSDRLTMLGAGSGVVVVILYDPLNKSNLHRVATFDA